MTELRRIGMFGGTFNPPHLGHVGAALDFVRGANLDELLVIPDAEPPHKPADGNISARDRLEMTKLAFSAVPKATVSDMEIRRGGKSYTSDTLSALTAPERDLYLLVGTDMFVTLDSWHEPERIFALATVCYVRREDDPEQAKLIEEKRAYFEEKYRARILPLDHEAYEVSSSDLREGKRPDALPASVQTYIKEHALYRDPNAEEAVAALRRRVSSEMGEKRFLHTLGVEKIAAKLGEILLPDKVSALRAAALLHDVTKEKTDEEIRVLLSAFPDAAVDFSFPPVVHAATAPYLIRRDYPAYATPEILEAVRLHTTGDVSMTLFSKIIFLSDFIEEGRTFPEAKTIRERLLSRLSENPAERYRIFDQELLVAFDETLGFLAKKGAAVSPLTKRAREALFATLNPA